MSALNFHHQPIDFVRGFRKFKRSRCGKLHHLEHRLNQLAPEVDLNLPASYRSVNRQLHHLRQIEQTLQGLHGEIVSTQQRRHWLASQLPYR